MAFSSFSDLKVALANWLARSDLSDYYDDLILLGERRLARDLRIRGIEVDLSVTLSSGVGTVPSDFLALKYAYIDLDPTRPLEVKDAQWIFRRFPGRSSGGVPEFIAADGSEFVFGQFPGSDYTIKGKYYARPAVLSTSNETNEWTSNVDDALLMACLSESAPFLKHDERIPTWEAKYEQIKNGYNIQQKQQTRRGATTSYR